MNVDVETYLKSFRFQELSIKKSVEIWMRRHPVVIVDNEIAPDGRKYLDGSIPKYERKIFTQPKAVGNQ